MSKKMRAFLRVRRQSVVAAAVVATLAFGLSACGGSPRTSTSTTAAGSTSRRSLNFQGTSGSVAGITGDSMEVQNPSSGQETVTWTSATRFSKTERLAVASITAGSCVTALGTTSGSTITARSVTISQPSSSGTCRTGFGRGAGAFPRGGAPFGGGGFPSGTTPSRSFPAGTGLPSIAIVSGKVVSAGSSSMVVDGVRLAGFRFGSSTSTTPTTAAPSDLTVALSSSTTVTTTESVTAASLAIGDCVTATGPSNSTGAVSATSIRITSSGGQTCGGHFGGGFFGGGGGTGSGGA